MIKNKCCGFELVLVQNYDTYYGPKIVKSSLFLKQMFNIIKPNIEVNIHVLQKNIHACLKNPKM